MPTASSSAARTPRASAVVTKNAILAAALNAFSARGFDVVTTRQIAAAAGIEQGHLAYYFASKEALWRETVARYNDAFERLLDQQPFVTDAEAQPDFGQLEALLRFFAANPPLTRLMLQEFSLRSPRRDWLVDHYGRPAWQSLRPLFEHLAARRGGGATAVSLYFAFLGGALLFFGSGDEIAEITGEPADQTSFIVNHLAGVTG